MYEVIIAAAEYNLTTLENVESELNSYDPALHGLFGQYIAAATSAIEAWCNRRFAVETVSETFNIPASQPWLVLRKTPVSAVSSITVDGVAYDLTGLALDKATGIIRGCWRGDIVVNYAGGYTLPNVSPMTLPASIERACLATVTFYVNQRAKDISVKSESVENVGSRQYFYGSDPMTLPLEAQALLEPYRIVIL
jgi:hypothetical protein